MGAFAADPVDGALFAALLSAASRDDALRVAMADGIRSGIDALAQRLDAEDRGLVLAPEKAALLVQVLVAGILAVKPVLGDDLPDDLLSVAAALLLPGAGR